jgi:hypothetical protein
MLNSPSKYIKSKGLPSLRHVSNMSGVSACTLHNWFKEDFRKFDVVVVGCAYLHSKGYGPADIKDFPNDDRKTF